MVIRRIRLLENQSTFIPIGQIHALENPGIIPLELIEVQSDLTWERMILSGLKMFTAV